jgi:hypothetical protein
MPVTNLKAFQDLVASHDLPHTYDPKRPTALGPDNYGASQTDPYFENWFFEIDGTTVTIGRQDGLGFPTTTVSSLYDSAFETEHLSGTFDDVAKEVLAWDLGVGASGVKEARVGAFFGGVEDWLTFSGYNPVCVNTWPIDGDAATAGDAEVGVFYLREGFPYIFFRTKGDNFATEYVALRSPSAPFALHSLALNGAYLEIRGIDVGHRKTAWRSLYSPAIPPDRGLGILELVAGSFESIYILEDVGQDEGEGTLELVAGSFESTVIATDAGIDEGEGTLELVAGELLNLLVLTDAGQDDGVGTLTLADGAFTLTGKPTETTSDDGVGTLALIEGTFEIP